MHLIFRLRQCPLAAQLMSVSFQQHQSAKLAEDSVLTYHMQLKCDDIPACSFASQQQQDLAHSGQSWGFATEEAGIVVAAFAAVARWVSRRIFSASRASKTTLVFPSLDEPSHRPVLDPFSPVVVGVLSSCQYTPMAPIPSRRRCEAAEADTDTT